MSKVNKWHKKYSARHSKIISVRSITTSTSAYVIVSKTQDAKKV